MSDTDSIAGRKRASEVSKKTMISIRQEKVAGPTDSMKQITNLLELDREKKLNVKNIFDIDF